VCLQTCLQVFLVDLRATKKSIKAAVARLYNIQCKKVNTLIRCVLVAGWSVVLLHRAGLTGSHQQVSVCEQNVDSWQTAGAGVAGPSVINHTWADRRPVEGAIMVCAPALLLVAGPMARRRHTCALQLTTMPWTLPTRLASSKLVTNSSGDRQFRVGLQ
jgi:hypothetical protein